MKRLPVLAVLVFSVPVLAQDHQAHVHGVAKIEIAVEGAEINLHLESPLEGVLGFEHAPRNDKERASVARMRKTMAHGGALFAPTSAAQCKLVEFKLEAPTLNARPAGKQGEHVAHGDLDADFRFTCAQPAKLTGLEVRLFEAFPKIRSVDAQVVSARGQKAMRLSSKMRFLSW